MLDPWRCHLLPVHQSDARPLRVPEEKHCEHFNRSTATSPNNTRSCRDCIGELCVTYCLLKVTTSKNTCLDAADGMEQLGLLWQDIERGEH
jgi:hypothetical protein